MPVSQAIVCTLRAKVQAAVRRSMFAALSREQGSTKLKPGVPTDEALEAMQGQRHALQQRAHLDLADQDATRRRERLAALTQSPKKGAAK